VFTHNGAADPDSVWVYGTVGSVSTRGDVNNDGYTDLIDLVLAVDHVVGLSPLPPEYAERVDLYPFPTGDDGVDVRDLTILVRAINSGSWPDGILVSSPIAFSKDAGAFEAELYVVGDHTSNDVRLNFAPGLRAVQLLLSSKSGLEPADVHPASMGEFVQFQVDRYRAGPKADGVVGVVAYTLEGPISSAPDFKLADVVVGPEDSLQVLLATGIDLVNKRVSIEFSEGDLPEVPDLSLAAPFPQPFSLGGHRRVLIQSTSAKAAMVTVSIEDVLGRTVFSAEATQVSRSHPFIWKGVTNSGTPAGPGLYFVRFRTDSDLETVPVVVVP
jgi:hypothetical protein